MVCPNCSSKMIKRKRRSFLQKILLFKPVYKCGVCKTTFKKSKMEVVC